MTGGEFEVGGNAYRWSRLDARKQFHVARRLAPILARVAAAADGAVAAAPPTAGEEPELTSPAAGLAFGGMDLAGVAHALAEMPDDQADYVLNTLLSVVQRRTAGGAAWGNVMTPGGALMFNDLDFGQMLQIAYPVLEGNLGGFFRALPSMSPPADETSPQA